MKIVYMGTPDFAVPALETICAKGWDVPLVITKPEVLRTLAELVREAFAAMEADERTYVSLRHSIVDKHSVDILHI